MGPFDHLSAPGKAQQYVASAWPVLSGLAVGYVYFAHRVDLGYEGAHAVRRARALLTAPTPYIPSHSGPKPVRVRQVLAISLRRTGRQTAGTGLSTILLI